MISIVNLNILLHRFCDICRRYCSKANKHCTKCDSCTTKVAYSLCFCYILYHHGRIFADAVCAIVEAVVITSSTLS